jgi:hypothetical protein
MNHLPGGDGVFVRRPYLRYYHTLAMRNLEFLSDLSVIRRRGCIRRAFVYDAPANGVLWNNPPNLENLGPSTR